ncbi:hypothetical protein [Xenorhabdus japonica]|uniref:Uncharacterized protein n=1 Tax=Xenorhabdus japonica TaxID=53341 RepID=A0A1I5EBL2_9GAMM|nr:hypothetical protein [Xenorhabdus japonica]SFO08919.1 hypothetical protein SAMN05421579_1622 [Xenorhabdus japonica]
MGDKLELRGGKRAGAGRPPIDKNLRKMPVTIKIPKWIIDWLNEQPETKVRLIENAIIKHYNISPP